MINLVGLSDADKALLEKHGNHLTVDTVISNPRNKKIIKDVSVLLEETEPRYTYEDFHTEHKLKSYVLKNGATVHERVKEELWEGDQLNIYTYLCWDDESPVQEEEIDVQRLQT